MTTNPGIVSRRKYLLMTAAGAGGLAGCAGTNQNDTDENGSDDTDDTDDTDDNMSDTDDKTCEPSKKEKVRQLLNSFETGDQESLEHIDSDGFIQHSLSLADGVEGIAQLLEELPQYSARVNIVRLFEDGNYVFAHTDYDFPESTGSDYSGSKIGFNVFRFEDGKIVEHWDNLQQEPDEPNPSGHTMIDGPTAATDRGKTEENKELVENFVEDTYVNMDLEEIETYFDGDNFIQHNPSVPDSLSGFLNAVEEMQNDGITLAFDQIHMVLGEGNFVLTVSEGEFTPVGDHVAFYDLWRVEEGYIAEHWDVIQAIPSEDEWENDNGKF